jgi:hypothetical protein
MRGRPAATGRNASRRRIAGALLVGGVLFAAPRAAGAASVPDWPNVARLGSAPAFSIRDRIISAAQARVALRQAAPSPPPFGGNFTTPSGSVVRVLESPSYQPDPSVLQAWANFFASLPHGDELAQLTVYLAPYSEMATICAPEADSCYAPDFNEIVLVGNSSPDGTPIEDIAAHEYGHHIANHRDNDPWQAIDWGPKYWATYENVCNLVGDHQAFPGGETDSLAHYYANPGEDWAETYRMLAGSKSAWTFSPLFTPSPGALAAARRDVLNPWTGDQYIIRRSRFARGSRSRWRDFTVPVQNDGTISVTVWGRGSLDPDIYIYDPQANKKLDSSTHNGGVESYSGSYCGYRRLDIAVYRYRGYGSFTARISLPYTT